MVKKRKYCPNIKLISSYLLQLTSCGEYLLRDNYVFGSVLGLANTTHL